MTKALQDLHIEEIKVRLTERHRQLLDALAINADIPPAVLARNIIVRSLERLALETKVSEQDLIGRP